MRVETRMFKEVTRLLLIAENRNEATALDLILGDCAKGDIQISGVLTCDADTLNPYIRIESAIAPPDQNCVTLPNGDCVGENCMHDAQPAASGEQTALITDKQIKHMVERFLGWRLPENFNPDAGISFKREFNEHTAHPMKHEPTGTNLFDYAQAEDMVRYMIEGMFIPSMDDKDGWVYDPDKRLAEIRAKMSERELVEKLAKILHHYVSAAQNIPENKGTRCCECAENIGIDFLPLVRSYVSQVAAAERQRCIAKCQEILESRKNGHAAGIEAAHLCAMEIESLAENVPERRR